MNYSRVSPSLSFSHEKNYWRTIWSLTELPCHHAWTKSTRRFDWFCKPNDSLFEIRGVAHDYIRKNWEALTIASTIILDVKVKLNALIKQILAPRRISKSLKMLRTAQLMERVASGKPYFFLHLKSIFVFVFKITCAEETNKHVEPRWAILLWVRMHGKRRVGKSHCCSP